MSRINRRRSSRKFHLDWLESRTLLSIVPNDPGFSSQWGLHNPNNIDIDAPEAWGITTGSSSVLMAVIDPTGVQFSHVDLDGKISPYSPTPPSSDHHATIIAGIMGAETNNGQGMAAGPELTLGNLGCLRQNASPRRNLFLEHELRGNNVVCAMNKDFNGRILTTLHGLAIQRKAVQSSSNPKN